ncbi:MAG: GYD domain-containing protein [Planctomycetaceae bacterium]
MATYITLIRFTEQGSRTIADTCGRATAFQASAQSAGITVRDVFWTMGPVDGVLIFDAPNDEAATGAMLSLSSQGNVQTQTCRAFDAGAMQQVLKNRPQ